MGPEACRPEGGRPSRGSSAFPGIQCHPASTGCDLRHLEAATSPAGGLGGTQLVEPAPGGRAPGGVRPRRWARVQIRSPSEPLGGKRGPGLPGVVAAPDPALAGSRWRRPCGRPCEGEARDVREGQAAAERARSGPGPRNGESLGSSRRPPVVPGQEVESAMVALAEPVRDLTKRLPKSSLRKMPRAVAARTSGADSAKATAVASAAEAEALALPRLAAVAATQQPWRWRPGRGARRPRPRPWPGGGLDPADHGREPPPGPHGRSSRKSPSSVPARTTWSRPPAAASDEHLAPFEARAEVPRAAGRGAARTPPWWRSAGCRRTSRPRVGVEDDLRDEALGEAVVRRR